jgi:hemoglobin
MHVYIIEDKMEQQMKLVLPAMLVIMFIFSGCSNSPEGCPKSKECPNKPSLYTRLGGQEAVDAAVEIFYKKVLADKKVSHFFDDVNMIRQRKRQKQFLGHVLGGPIKYEGRDMRRAPKGLKLTEEHFNAIAGHLKATLQELKVDAGLIDEVIALVATTKKDVLNQ